MIKIRTVQESERELFKKLFRDYYNELARYSAKLQVTTLSEKNVDHCFSVSRLKKLFIIQEGVVIGFCIMSAALYDGSFAYCRIEEFYILPEYRRMGYGTAVAQGLLNNYPCDWFLHVLKHNTPAQKFWHKVFEGINYGVTELTDKHAALDDCLSWWIYKL